MIHSFYTGGSTLWTEHWVLFSMPLTPCITATQPHTVSNYRHYSIHALAHTHTLQIQMIVVIVVNALNSIKLERNFRMLFEFEFDAHFIICVFILENFIQIDCLLNVGHIFTPPTMNVNVFQCQKNRCGDTENKNQTIESLYLLANLIAI